MAIRRAVLFSGLVLDLDITYIFVLALFLLPLLILNGVLFQPFLNLFERRHEQVEGAIARAERRLTEAEAKAKSFEEKIQVATTRGIEARNRIRTEAQKAMNARIDQERQALAQKLSGALADIQKARQASLAEVEQQSKRLAELTASKLLGRGI
jgi:F0F1-type ATP synthase membrane subunit b/b'